jgi:ethanolamine utilization protein EutP (predicted NTPase)
MEKTGLLIQFDGSYHKWFDHRESCLIAAIDDADSELIHGEFFKSEDILSCMAVLQKIIEKKGIFNILYVDRAGVYGGPKRTEFSQVKRALAEIGIHTIFASSAQGKGRVERLFDTLQDRVIPEMRLRDIRGFHNANEFLEKVYIPDHNSKFKVTPKSLITAFRPLPAGLNLNEVFCIKHKRIILNDHTFSYKGEYYIIKSPTRFTVKGLTIEIRTYQNGCRKAFLAGTEVEMQQVYKPLPHYKRKAA